MSFVVRYAQSEKELKDILDLRYEVLRKPWDQPAATATDEHEGRSMNAYISNGSGDVLACARLQENENKIGQVRFMAVRADQQGKGLGKIIMNSVEEKAKQMGLVKIELQARENAVKFYESCGYRIEQKTFLLWGIIQHWLMGKKI